MICATPKSISFSMPSLRTMTFSGLTSRWMMPSEWACTSAPPISMAISAATSGAGGLPVGHELLERLPVDELGDDVRGRRFVARVVEDLHDVVVVQLGHRLGLALEARLRLGLGQQVRVQHLDRHLALQRLVVRPVHDRHAALADFFDDPITGGEPSLQHEEPRGLCGMEAESARDPIISTFQTKFHSSRASFFPPENHAAKPSDT